MRVIRVGGLLGRSLNFNIIFFYILPITVANAECIFGKLKLIKNYTRNSMDQSRISELYYNIS